MENKKTPGLLREVASIFDKKQRRQFLGLGVMILIVGLLETLGVSAMIPVVTAILSPDTLNEYLDKIPVLSDLLRMLNIDTKSQSLTVFLIVILIVIFIVKNLFILFSTYMQNGFISFTRNMMISRVMREFLNRPYEDYLGADIPTIFRITDSDIPNSFTLVMDMLNIACEIVVSFLIFLVLLFQDAKLTIFIVIVFGVMTVFISKLFKPMANKTGAANQKIQSRIAKWRIQATYGLKDVKVLNREDFFIRNYYESGLIGAKLQRTYAVLNSSPRLLLETAFIISVLGYIAVYIMGDGDVTAMMTTLTTFAVAAMRVLPSVNRINTYMTDIAYMRPCLDFVYENLQEGMKVDKAMAAIKAEAQAEPLVLNDKIELKNIHFHYPDTDKNIFEGAFMEVHKGQSVGIMGPSGAGKSTVVDILLGLLHAQEGEITCDGISIFKNYESWLGQIGYIPQVIYLIDESIRDNIAFGIDADKIDEDRIWQVLKEAQLDEFIKSLPEGLDTTIGDRGIRLSGGQRQRIGIARALYNNPEILVFDEATSALDNDTEAAVMDAINSFHGRKTMVIIAHRLNTIANCDVIYKVDNGLIEKTDLH